MQSASKVLMYVYASLQFWLTTSMQEMRGSFHANENQSDNCGCLQSVKILPRYALQENLWERFRKLISEKEFETTRASDIT